MYPPASPLRRPSPTGAQRRIDQRRPRVRFVRRYVLDCATFGVRLAGWSVWPAGAGSPGPRAAEDMAHIFAPQAHSLNANGPAGSLRRGLSSLIFNDVRRKTARRIPPAGCFHSFSQHIPCHSIASAAPQSRLCGDPVLFHLRGRSEFALAPRFFLRKNTRTPHPRREGVRRKQPAEFLRRAVFIHSLSRSPATAWRRPPRKAGFAGAPFYFTCAGEVNSPLRRDFSSGKILARRTRGGKVSDANSPPNSSGGLFLSILSADPLPQHGVGHPAKRALRGPRFISLARAK